MVGDRDAGQSGVRLVNGSAAVGLLEDVKVRTGRGGPLRGLHERCRGERWVVCALGLEDHS